jgi:uncharacterized membrane protein YkoI
MFSIVQMSAHHTMENPMSRYSRYNRMAIAAAALAAVAGTAAYAAQTAENDALAAPAAKVSLSQAVAAAEQRVGGRVVRAEYEQVKAGWAYDVEVVSGAKVFDVRVDANRGVVLSAVDDKTDHDDGHDKKD